MTRKREPAAELIDQMAYLRGIGTPRPEMWRQLGFGVSVYYSGCVRPRSSTGSASSRRWACSIRRTRRHSRCARSRRTGAGRCVMSRTDPTPATPSPVPEGTVRGCVRERKSTEDSTPNRTYGLRICPVDGRSFEATTPNQVYCPPTDQDRAGPRNSQPRSRCTKRADNAKQRDQDPTARPCRPRSTVPGVRSVVCRV